MKITKIPYTNIPQISKRDKTYAHEENLLKDFVKYPVHLDSFDQIIKDKKKETINREALAAVLKAQYKSLKEQPEVLKNIERLKDENTFTVTTAHQPSLFTGPLYFIYKIISVLNLAKTLNEKYDDYHFVPIFLTGGEDHDFEEVNHLHLFNKTLTWESKESGSVGAMSTFHIWPIIEELKSLMGEGKNAAKIYTLLRSAHRGNRHYSEAVVQMVHELFEGYGLVILNPIHPKLKELFLPVVKEELFNRVSHNLISDTISQLEEKGFKAQANPREINLFYLSAQLRERIVFEDGLYNVLNTEFQFTEEEISEELYKHPERFSPNVILRPLYQEMILPNLAYIGGGGELAYWMERKSLFEHFGINFPMLIRRHSVLWIDKGSRKKMAKFQLDTISLFDETERIIKNFVKQQTNEEISLEEEKKAIAQFFENIKSKTKNIDPSLVKAVSAEEAKLMKSLGNLEGRLLKAEKQKFETSINQIRNLKDKLFPNGGLQERYDNFIPLYLKYGENFVATLYNAFEALEKNFVIIEDIN